MDNKYLYRAKRLDNGEWVQGYYVKGLDVFTNCEEIHIMFEPNTMFYSSGETDGWYRVDPYTICQCTGLKDKNGNLIWENDIVHGKMHENYRYRKLVGVVQYYIDAFKVNVEPNSFFGNYKNISNTCEVIGNIFNNPELLESEDKEECF